MKKYIIVEESSNRKSIVGEMSYKENAKELAEFLNKISKVERISMRYYVYELIED